MRLTNAVQSIQAKTRPYDRPLSYVGMALILLAVWLVDIPVFAFVLACLAVYRLSRMVIAEDGPFDVFGRIRWLVYKDPRKHGWVQKGFSCVLCVSFWISWPIALLLPFGNWQTYVLSALGSAGVVLLIQKVVR